MNADRFRVGSLTGYPITNSDTRNTNSRASTIWYVHDSLIMFHVVQEFRGKRAEQRARALADHLNTPPVPKAKRKRVRRRGGVPLCINDHQLHPWNLRTDKQGVQHCRVCEYDRAKRYQDKKKAARAA